MKQPEAIFGGLSLLALFVGVLVGVASTIGMVSGAEEMASLGAAIAGIGLGLMACIPSLVFAVIGIWRKEKPSWPALLGFILSVFPGGLGLYMLAKLLGDGFKHFLKYNQLRSPRLAGWGFPLQTTLPHPPRLGSPPQALPCQLLQPPLHSASGADRSPAPAPSVSGHPQRSASLTTGEVDKRARDR